MANKKKALSVGLSLVLSLSLLLGVAINALADSSDTTTSLPEDEAVQEVLDDGPTEDSVDDNDDVVVEGLDEDEDEEEELVGEDPAPADNDGGQESTPAPETQPETEAETETRAVAPMMNPVGDMSLFGGVADALAEPIYEGDLALLRFVMTMDNDPGTLVNGKTQRVSVNINPQYDWADTYGKLTDATVTLKSSVAGGVGEFRMQYTAQQNGVEALWNNVDPYEGQLTDELSIKFDTLDTSKYDETDTIFNIYMEFVNGVTPNGAVGELYIDSFSFTAEDGKRYVYTRDDAEPGLTLKAVGTTSWGYTAVPGAQTVDLGAGVAIAADGTGTIDTSDKVLQWTVANNNTTATENVEPTTKLAYAVRLTVSAGFAIETDDINTAGTGGVLYDADGDEITANTRLVANEVVTVVWEEANPATSFTPKIVVDKVYIANGGTAIEAGKTYSFTTMFTVRVGGTYAKSDWSKSWGVSTDDEDGVALSAVSTSAITVRYRKLTAETIRNTDPKLVAHGSGTALVPQKEWLYSSDPKATSTTFGASGEETRNKVYYNTILGDPMHYAYWVDVVGMEVPAGNTYYVNNELKNLTIDTMKHTVRSDNATKHYFNPVGFNPGAFTKTGAFKVTGTVVNASGQSQGDFIFTFDEDGKITNASGTALSFFNTSATGYTGELYLNNYPATVNGLYIEPLTWEFTGVDADMTVVEGKVPSVLFAIMDLNTHPETESTWTKDDTTGGVFSLKNRLASEMIVNDSSIDPNKVTYNYLGSNVVNWILQEGNQKIAKSGKAYDASDTGLTTELNRTLKPGDIIDFTLTAKVDRHWTNFLIRDVSQYLDVSGLSDIIIELHPDENGNYGNFTQYPRSDLLTIGGTPASVTDKGTYLEYKINAADVYKVIGGNANTTAAPYASVISASEFAPTGNGFALYFKGLDNGSKGLYKGDELIIRYTTPVSMAYDDAAIKAGHVPNNSAYNKAWNKGPIPPPWNPGGNWEGPRRGKMLAAVELTMGTVTSNTTTGYLPRDVENSATLFGAVGQQSDDAAPKGPVFVYQVYSNVNHNVRFGGMSESDVKLIASRNALDEAIANNSNVGAAQKVYTDLGGDAKYKELVEKYVTEVQYFDMGAGWKSSTQKGARTGTSLGSLVAETDYSVRFYSTYDAAAPTYSEATGAAVQFIVISFNPAKVVMEENYAVQAKVEGWSYTGTSTQLNTSKLTFSPTNDMFVDTQVFESIGYLGRGAISELSLVKSGASLYAGYTKRENYDKDTLFPHIYTANVTTHYDGRKYMLTNEASVENTSSTDTNDKNFYKGDVLLHTYTVKNATSHYYADEAIDFNAFSVILPEGQEFKDGTFKAVVGNVTLENDDLTIATPRQLDDGRWQTWVTWSASTPLAKGATAKLTFKSDVVTVDDATWVDRGAIVPVITEYSGYFAPIDHIDTSNLFTTADDTPVTPQWRGLAGIATDAYRITATSKGENYGAHIKPGVTIDIASGAKESGGNYFIDNAKDSLLLYGVEVRNPIDSNFGSHHEDMEDYLLVVILPAGANFEYVTDVKDVKGPETTTNAPLTNADGQQYFENGFGEQVLVWKTSLAAGQTWTVYLRTILAGTHVGNMTAEAYLVPYQQHYDSISQHATKATAQQVTFDTNTYHRMVSMVDGINVLLDGRVEDAEQRLSRSDHTPMIKDLVSVDVTNAIGASAYLEMTSGGITTSNSIIEVERDSTIDFSSQLRNRSTNTTYSDIVLYEVLPSGNNLSGWEPTLLLENGYALTVIDDEDQSVREIDKATYEVWLLPNKVKLDEAKGLTRAADGTVTEAGNWIPWDSYDIDDPILGNPSVIMVVFGDNKLESNETADFEWSMHVEEYMELDKFNLNAYASSRYQFRASNSSFYLRSTTVGMRVLYSEADSSVMTVTKQIKESIQPGKFWFELQRWVSGERYDRIELESKYFEAPYDVNLDEDTGLFYIEVPAGQTEASIVITGLEEGRYKIVEQDVPETTNDVYEVEYANVAYDPDDPDSKEYVREYGPKIELYSDRETNVFVTNTDMAVVIYHAGAGTGDDYPVYAPLNSLHNLLGNDVTDFTPPYGYVFDSWSLAPASSTTTYQPGYDIPVNKWEVHVWAVYVHDGSTYYTLTYDPNGGVGGGSVKVIPGTSVTIAQPGDHDVSREGYRFLGWSAQRTGGANSNYAPGKKLTLTGDMTLYAIWEKEDDGGSSGGGGNSTGGGSSSTSSGSSSRGGIDGSNDIGGSTTSRRGGGGGGGESSSDAPIVPVIPATSGPDSSAPTSTRSSSNRDTNPSGNGDGNGNTGDGTGGAGEGDGAEGGGLATDGLGDASVVAPGDFDPNDTMNIAGLDIPRGGLTVTKAWSLLNLVVSIIGILCGVITTVTTLRRRDGKRRAGLLKISAAISSLLPIILFLILEDLRSPMVFITKWTPIILMAFALQLLLVVLAGVRARQELKNEEDGGGENPEAPAPA